MKGVASVRGRAAAGSVARSNVWSSVAAQGCTALARRGERAGGSPPFRRTIHDFGAAGEADFAKSPALMIVIFDGLIQ